MRNNFKMPNGWVETTFGAIVSTVSVNEKKLPRGEYLESGLFPVVDQGQQFIGGYSNDETKVISEDLPVLVFGDHTRAFKYLDQPFVAGADGIKVLKPIGVDAKWLYQIAHALEFPDKGYARHYQHLKTAKIFVPPLPEQRRIVAEIEKQFSRLEGGVSALKRVQANLKRYRAAVLKAACEGKLVPTEAELHKSGSGVSPLKKSRDGSSTLPYESGEQLLKRILEERHKKWSGRGQYKEPEAPDTTNLPQLPKGWTWASFEQLSERVTVGFVGSMKHEYVSDGVPFLRGQNVRENKFDPEGLLYVSKEFHAKLCKSAIHPGDLAVVRSGSVGVTCVIPETLAEANCSDLVLIQRPLGFVPQYGAYFMNSLAKRHVEAGKVGVALIHFNTKSVAAMLVPIPPLAEQKRIVEEVERRLSVVEELEALVTTNLQRATRLRQAVLHKAFTGEHHQQSEPNRRSIC